MTPPNLEHFLVEKPEVLSRLHDIDPRAYDKTRNYLDGAVTWLSPFLTHGIISTSDVAEAVLASSKPKSCYRLLFELAWREFFHRTWQHHGDAIFGDMREDTGPQRPAGLPQAVHQAQTGIDVIDHSLEHLCTQGTMHNHARMWVAAITCNQAQRHWFDPARWMHAHLLDGDLASNTLSWQWVAGTLIDKRYYANQDNINRYSGITQTGTWLDVDYESLPDMPVADHLHDSASLDFSTDNTPPGEPTTAIELDPQSPLALRSIWSLDPQWQSDIEQQIVFVDRAMNDAWPMTNKRWQLIEHWAARCGATLCHGSLDDLHKACEGLEVLREEYPACNAWPGKTLQRRWLYPDPDKPYRSFSAFWKHVRPSIGL